jgi:hypothetical protein
MAKCYFLYGILSENPGSDEGKFLRVGNILKFAKENTKQAQLPANQLLLIVVDINIY